MDDTPQGGDDGEQRRSRPPGRVLAIVLGGQLLLGAALLAWVLLGRPLPGGDDSQAPAAQAPAAEVASTSPGALPPIPTADRFDEEAAFALLARQVEEYGPRPAGSEASRRLAEELADLLPNGKLEPIGGGLRNVVGTIPGKGKPILLGAHYDTEATVPGHVGANDGAAGTAAVVEIARTLAKEKRGADAPALRFVLFDGEEEPADRPDPQEFFEVGLRGSKAEAERRPLPRAMILLDYIAEAKDLSIPRASNSDEELWARLRAAAGRVGTTAIFPDTTGPGIIDDHVPFVYAGVPAIDLIDFDYPQRDSTDDNLSAVSARSLDAVGETVLELIRSW